jgi:gluconolactonase
MVNLENKTGEIGINGVFKVSSDKEVSLLVDSLSWPNGIALSPDQQTLYINQSDPETRFYTVMTSPGMDHLKTGKYYLTLKRLQKCQRITRRIKNSQKR